MTADNRQADQGGPKGKRLSPSKQLKREKRRGRRAAECEPAVNGHGKASDSPLSPEQEPLFGKPGTAGNGSLEALWTGRIWDCCFGVLDGPSFAGKSTLAAAFVAAVTGGPRPAGWLEREPGPALWVSVEEPWHGMIEPRLKAAGANPDLVHCLLPRHSRGGRARLYLPEELPLLRHEIRRLGVRFVFLDPLTSSLGPKVNVNSEQEMRAVCEGLAEIAHEEHCVILASRQDKKDEARSGIHQGLGSAAIAAVARSLLSLRQPAADQDYRVLTVEGFNGGEPAPPIIVRAEKVGKVLKAVFGEELPPGDPRGAATGQDRAELKAAGVCERFILGELEEGKVLTSELNKRGRSLGLSEKQIWRAKQKLGIEDDYEPKNNGKIWHTLPLGEKPKRRRRK